MDRTFVSREYFLTTTLENIKQDMSQDDYVLELLQRISLFIADNAKWGRLPDPERAEIEQLLTIVNKGMEMVVTSKKLITDPNTGQVLSTADTHATGLFRGGLVNAIIKLKYKAEAAT